LLTLKGSFPHLRKVVPARLQSYMAAAKPVLAMIDEGAAEIIKDAQSGFAVLPDDVQGFVDIIKEQVLTDKKAFADMGENGRKYFEKYFEKNKCIDNLCEIISSNNNLQDA